MWVSLRGWVLVAAVWPVLAVVAFVSAAGDDSFDGEGVVS